MLLQLGQQLTVNALAPQLLLKQVERLRFFQFATLWAHLRRMSTESATHPPRQLIQSTRHPHCSPTAVSKELNLVVDCVRKKEAVVPVPNARAQAIISVRPFRVVPDAQLPHERAKRLAGVKMKPVRIPFKWCPFHVSVEASYQEWVQLHHGDTHWSKWYASDSRSEHPFEPHSAQPKACEARKSSTNLVLAHTWGVFEMIERLRTMPAKMRPRDNHVPTTMRGQTCSLMCELLKRGEPPHLHGMRMPNNEFSHNSRMERQLPLAVEQRVECCRLKQERPHSAPH